MIDLIPNIPRLDLTTPINQGVVLDLPFFERAGAQAADVSLYENHASVRVGSPAVMWVAGDQGPAIAPDAVDDYWAVDHAAELMPSDFLSVAVAFRFTGTLTSFDSLFMKTTSSAWTDGYGLFWEGSTGELRFFVSSWNAQVGRIPFANGDTDRHIAVGVYDGRAVRLFLDGREGISTAYSSPITATTADLWIGSGKTTTAMNYKPPVEIDHVRIYNRPLARSEVERLSRGRARLYQRSAAPRGVAVDIERTYPRGMTRGLTRGAA